MQCLRTMYNFKFLAMKLPMSFVNEFFASYLLAHCFCFCTSSFSVRTTKTVIGHFDSFVVLLTKFKDMFTHKLKHIQTDT